ncbi:MAG: O-antigen ligase family protein, partial [Candidatus Thermoplasmatota archaeon]|nr:O-antigen ligase family protein [Candidatus Thermoplasmatota archaeon]
TNSLAGYLAPWLVITTGIALLAGWKRRRFFFATALCGILIAACLVLTKSRSAYAATGLGLVLTGFYCSKYRKRVAWRWLLVGLLVAAVLGGVALAVGGLDVEVFSEASKSLGYRVQYWQSTARMIADRPLWGCGPGQFQGAYTFYKLPEASEEIAEPHNFLLEIWATAGTPAALALIAVIVCFAWSITRPNTNPKRKRWESDSDTNPTRKRGESDSGASDSSDSSDSSAPSLALRVSEDEQQTTPTEPTNQNDATAWVLGGGVAGLLAAWPLGVMAAIPPSLAVLLVGAPLGILAGYFLFDWVNCSLGKGAARIDQQPLAGFAIITLLVNLLAAGGIGFAGVAGSLWILVALGLFSESLQESRPLRPLVAPTVAALLAILGVMCYVTAYSPVLNSQSHTQAALNDPARAREHLRAAAVADPLSAQPSRQLAMLYFDAWRRDRNPRDLQNFEQFMAIALEIDSGSSSAWQMSADRYLEAYAHTRRPADLEHAVAAYRRAVGLYPADATTRAKFAIALRMAGKAEESAKEAKMAEKLDEQTPHTDRKMPESLRRRLMQTPK